MTPLLVVLCLLAGCGQRELIETPNLYLEPDLYPFADVPSPLRTNTVDILYATDRKREGNEDDPVKYGYRRSVPASPESDLGRRSRRPSGEG
jgi:esterase/lipase superfamily enzyme